jgi:hypothetical protein
MSKTIYKTTVLKVSVHPKWGSPLLDESATHVSLEDDGGGPFIQLLQNSADFEQGRVRLELDELEPVAAACRALIAGVKE